MERRHTAATRITAYSNRGAGRPRTRDRCSALRQLAVVARRVHVLRRMTLPYSSISLSLRVAAVTAVRYGPIRRYARADARRYSARRPRSGSASGLAVAPSTTTSCRAASVPPAPSGEPRDTASYMPRPTVCPAITPTATTSAVPRHYSSHVCPLTTPHVRASRIHSPREHCRQVKPLAVPSLPATPVDDTSHHLGGISAISSATPRPRIVLENRIQIVVVVVVVGHQTT